MTHTSDETMERSAWIKGPKFPCPPGSDSRQGRKWNLILLGGPGVGKGTQAEKLKDHLGVCPLSTGDIFRYAMGHEEELSNKLSEAVHIMKSGGLVDDDTVIELLRERSSCLRCNRGFLLDGFPRTVYQAVALDGLLSELNIALDAVISYELPEAELVERLSGRRVCSHCRKSYHIAFSPPEKEGVCDNCGHDLFQREDDTPDVIRQRFKAFEEQASPTRNFYRERGILHTVDANASPDEVFQRTMAGLQISI